MAVIFSRFYISSIRERTIKTCHICPKRLCEKIIKLVFQLIAEKKCGFLTTRLWSATFYCSYFAKLVDKITIAFGKEAVNATPMTVVIVESRGADFSVRILLKHFFRKLNHFIAFVIVGIGSINHGLRLL